MSNEDAFILDNDIGLYVVADGMGGHAAGEVASQEAVETVLGMVRRGYAAVERFDVEGPTPDTVRGVQRLLESAVQAATYMVFAIAENDPEQKGMGTTVSALLLMKSHAVVAQVGDSRIYLVREGAVYQLTEDHTLVAWQVKQGISSEAEAELSPHKNVITRAVGSRDYVQVDTQTVEIGPGDRFLVCSDGLHGYLQDEEIVPLLTLGPDVATTKLIDLANQRGGRASEYAGVGEYAGARAPGARRGLAATSADLLRAEFAERRIEAVPEIRGAFDGELVARVLAQPPRKGGALFLSQVAPVELGEPVRRLELFFAARRQRHDFGAQFVSHGNGPPDLRRASRRAHRPDPPQSSSPLHNLART